MQTDKRRVVEQSREQMGQLCQRHIESLSRFVHLLVVQVDHSLLSTTFARHITEFVMLFAF